MMFLTFGTTACRLLEEGTKSPLPPAERRFQTGRGKVNVRTKRSAERLTERLPKPRLCGKFLSLTFGIEKPNRTITSFQPMK